MVNRGFKSHSIVCRSSLAIKEYITQYCVQVDGAVGKRVCLTLILGQTEGPQFEAHGGHKNVKLPLALSSHTVILCHFFLFLFF